MSEWKEYKLGELLMIKYGKNQKEVEDASGPFPIYGTGGLMGHATRPLHDKPSILIGRKGTIDKVRYVEHPFWTVDTLFYSEINEDLVIPKFLYYRMCTINFMNYNEGTTIPSLRTETLNRLTLKVPPLAEQRRIAEILGSLDDKIGLNSAINRNLEEQARALFKNWFIDFAPFGGVVPGEWKIGSLADIAKITSGKRPPMKQAESSKDVNIPLVGAASIMGFTNKVLYEEPILVTGRVGTHGVIQRFSSKCWPSDNTLVIKSKYYEFMYQILKNIDFSNMNRGSTQPLITQSDLGKIDCVIPSENALQKFEDYVKSFFNVIDANNAETYRLTFIRDTLLPKLMSGNAKAAGF